MKLRIFRNQHNKDYSLYNKAYSKFVVAAILVVSVVILVFACFSLVQYKAENQRILIKEAENIHNIIFESFDYSNRINVYLGRQIAEHGAEDLNYILYLFKEADKIRDVNFGLLSWASFDWVSNKNMQVINAKTGIHKWPVDMSSRDYTKTAPKDPWHLKVSVPTYGVPSGVWVVPAGTGVVNKAGKFLGIIAVGFDIESLLKRIQKGINNDISFIVLDKRLNVIVQSPDNLKINQDFYKKSKINIKFLEESGKLEKEIMVGDIRYSAYDKIDKFGYVILTGFNKEFLASRLINITTPYAIGFVMSFFLMALYLLKVKISILLDKEKKLTSSLHIANISKIELIRATSHDLRNYIFGISGLAKLLLERNTIKNDDLELIRSIDEQSDECGYFVEDLLDTNQNENGIFNLNKVEKNDIYKLIQRMVLLNKSLAIKHRIEIITDISHNMTKLRCDARRMKQILNNLITNAIKYSKADTVVTITAKQLRSKKQIYIEIKDQGIGMSEEEIAMALAGRGEDINKSTIDKDIDSRGIGMPIVKRLVELHNGKIEISSVKNEGTVVGLYFNLDDESLKEEMSIEEVEGGKEELVQKMSIEDKLILIVDDNPVNVKIITVILKRVGCKVKNAKNGVDAISMLDRENFDLILMDGEMPVMDGYEAARTIRDGQVFKNFNNYHNIPIIAITANSDSETITKVRDCKMNGYLSKASSAKEIIDMVSGLLY